MSRTDQFGDREMMEDALASQNALTESYNALANECASPALLNEFMNILNEEHQLQHEALDELQKRGWRRAEPAPQQQVEACRRQFSQG